MKLRRKGRDYRCPGRGTPTKAVQSAGNRSVDETSEQTAEITRQPRRYQPKDVTSFPAASVGAALLSDFRTKSPSRSILARRDLRCFIATCFRSFPSITARIFARNCLLYLLTTDGYFPPAVSTMPDHRSAPNARENQPISNGLSWLSGVTGNQSLDFSGVPRMSP